jgi:hypothetical protein
MKMLYKKWQEFSVECKIMNFKNLEMCFRSSDNHNKRVASSFQ